MGGRGGGGGGGGGGLRGVVTTKSHVWSMKSEPSRGLSLIILAGGAPKVVELPVDGLSTTEIILGRGDSCSVIVDDASVSREHAVLRITNMTTITLQDLGSRNGTRLGGKPLASKAPPQVVTHNQVIELGAVVMVVRGPPEATSASPTTTTTTTTTTTRPTTIAELGVKMTEAYALADLAAPTPVTVLLLGETGVGKTAIAERLHAQSGRSGPLIKLNCAAVPESLLEGELFGHERGAFTGAQIAKAGLIEAATNGTLLLDEIGDMPLSTQAKLLHVVEEGEVTRLGATKPRSVDVRFLAATHRDLSAMVTEKTFRADLYYRVNGIAITLPPLRERREEILGLAEHFLSMTCAKMKRAHLPALSKAAEAALLSHAWPGNLRELRNVMDRAMLLTKDGEEVSVVALGLAQSFSAPPGAGSGTNNDLRAEIDSFEKEKILRALDEVGGNQTKAADLVGLPLRTFVKRLTHYGLTKPKPKKSS